MFLEFEFRVLVTRDELVLMAKSKHSTIKRFYESECLVLRKRSVKT